MLSLYHTFTCLTALIVAFEERQEQVEKEETIYTQA